MSTQTVRDLKPGDYFRFITFKGEANPVYVRGEYDRAFKRYTVSKFEDVNHERFVKGSALVSINFDF